MISFLDKKIDTMAFSVSKGFSISEEIEYWQSKTPEERLNAVEHMRQINYGDSYTRHIQRFFEVV